MNRECSVTVSKLATKFDSSGRLVLEPKDKQRVGFSADLGDAAALTFAIDFNEDESAGPIVDRRMGNHGWQFRSARWTKKTDKMNLCVSSGCNRTAGSNPTLSILTWLCIRGCGRVPSLGYVPGYTGNSKGRKAVNPGLLGEALRGSAGLYESQPWPVIGAGSGGRSTLDVDELDASGAKSEPAAKGCIRRLAPTPYHNRLTDGL